MRRFLCATAAAITLAGSVAAEPIRFARYPNVSNDGTIAFTYHGDIWLVNSDGTNPRRLTAHIARDINPRFSPDGRWIAHVSYETGSPEVYVQPFPPVGRKVRVSFNGGMQPSWRRDGKELYYLAPDRTLMSVAVRDSPAAPDVGEPAPLFRAPVPMPAWGRSHYQASMDGSRFLLTVLDSTQLPPSPDVVVVHDWARTMYDELRR